MPSDTADGSPAERDGTTLESVEYLLFDSLVHHLIEKGLLTKNDALSVVQTAAEIVRGRKGESDTADKRVNASLATLERTYASFEALRDGRNRSGLDARNVHQLRTPLHGDHPRFPSAEDDD